MKLMVILSGLICLFASSSYATIQNARIHQRIYPTLDVKRLSDMYFPDAYPGSPAFTIDPGSSESAQNASFIVSGESGKRVTVILPSEKIELQNAQSGAKIHVSQFKANTGTSAVLDRHGDLKIYVGATRHEIPTRIPSGDYTGSFTITVMY